MSAPLSGVYFARTGDAIKIGVSTNVWQRMQALSTSSPMRVELLAVIPGEVTDEKAFHRRFQHLRLNGEWFRADGELLDFIAVLPPPPEHNRRSSALSGEQEAAAGAVVALHHRRQEIEAKYKQALARLTDRDNGDGVPIAYIATRLGIERKTVYRHLGRSMS